MNEVGIEDEQLQQHLSEHERLDHHETATGRLDHLVAVVVVYRDDGPKELLVQDSIQHKNDARGWR